MGNYWLDKQEDSVSFVLKSKGEDRTIKVYDLKSSEEQKAFLEKIKKMMLQRKSR